MQEVVRMAFCRVDRLFYKTNYATESHVNDFVNAKSHAREKALLAVCVCVCARARVFCPLACVAFV